MLPWFIGSAQVAGAPAAFLAINAGGFVSGVQRFDAFYRSRMAFSYGATLGIPAQDHLYLLAKFTHFSRSGVVITGMSNFNGEPIPTPQLVTGRLDVSQWIFNFGGLREVFTSEEIGLALDGGLTYSSFSTFATDYTPGNTVPPAPVADHRMLGIFAGLVLEHRFAESQLSLIADVQYNQLWPITSPHVPTYGGLNASGGIRFYLEHR